MDLKNIFILIIGLLNVFLGFVVYLKNRKSPSNFWFFIMCLFGGGWGIIKAIQLTVLDVYWHEILISRILMIFGMMAPLAYFMLAYHFPYKIRLFSKNLLFFIFFIPLILMGLTALGILRYVNVSVINNTLHREIILFDFSVFAIYFFAYVILGAGILLKKYRSAEGIHKLQIKYLLFGRYPISRTLVP